MVDFIALGLILDDMVLPDGTVVMGNLGGGGPQTAFGMRLWSESVGLLAAVGNDFPKSASDWFNSSGIDLDGLIRTDLPTVRGWHLSESDGSSRLVFRTTSTATKYQLRRYAGDIPPSYSSARGLHFSANPNEPDVIHFLIERFRSVFDMNALISLETFRSSNSVLETAVLKDILTRIDIFSANLEEARSVVGGKTISELIDRLLNLGAKAVTLRLGADGSVVSSQKSGEKWHIPAFQTSVTQQTGAGNAYCGAFLVGFADSADVVYGGLRGAVAASFILPQIGMPIITPSLTEIAHRRLLQHESAVRLL